MSATDGRRDARGGRTPPRLLRWAIAAAAAAVLVPAGAAGADPPAPTDYESEIVSITPQTPEIAVDIVGGDSFVRLRVDRGTAVVVIGYFGEPFVRISSDGEVQRNRQSPSVELSESRDGDGRVVGSAAEISGRLPEWETVAHDGEFLWHDHRTHLMTPSPPAGYQRGDRVTDDVVPLLVDDVEVEVRVISTWLPAPSRAPVVIGAVLGGFGVLILLSIRARLAWLLAVTAAAAGGLGWWQYASVPAATGPSQLDFALPSIAAAAAVLAVVFGRTLISHALVLLGALQLGVWVYLRREVFIRALLPTEAPFWLDRGVTAAAGVAAAAAALAGGLAMLRNPGPTQQPAQPAPKRSKQSAGVTTFGRKR